MSSDVADAMSQPPAGRPPKKPQIVFFGSGPVAARSLEMLLEWCDIEAVITKPQPAHHREQFPVIAVAEAHDLPLHTASNRRELDTLMNGIAIEPGPSETATGAGFQSRVAILIDYGIIVSRQVIDSFELGIINSHFSVLPEWRGADPITFAILSGQKQTGVSLMLLVEAMDEGPLLGYGEQDLDPDITTPELTERLIQLSDALLRHDLPRHIAGETAGGAPQTVTGREVSYSRKLSKADGLLDFDKPAAELEREIRAYIEWPKSRTSLGGKDVIVTKACFKAGQLPADASDSKQGVVAADKDAGVIMITTSDGLLCIEKLKPAGKAEMSAAAFLAGNKL